MGGTVPPAGQASDEGRGFYPSIVSPLPPQAYGSFPPDGSQQGFIPAPQSLAPAPIRYFSDRLPFCGLGVGMFLFILGFFLPVAWFIGAFIFFFVEIVNSDNRERTGLMACTIAAGVLAGLLFASGGFAAIWGFLTGTDFRHMVGASGQNIVDTTRKMLQ